MSDHANESAGRDQIAVAAAALVKERATALPDDRVCHLAAMRELMGFQLGAERADIRSWPVYASDARLVGAVDRLMVETATGRIRYASVALAYYAADDNRPTASGSVLVPIGLVRRLDDRQEITLDALTSLALVSAPRVHARPVTRGDENATLAVYGMATSRDVAAGDLYANVTFDDGRLQLAGS
ncbi:MAG: PRC-barrel domain-containing protein [Gemmatimonadaceae bacterium]